MISGDDPRHVAMLMLTALCAYMENNEKEEVLTQSQLSAFDAFRAEVLHEQIERKNRNGAPAVHGIARLCGFYSIYSDMLLWLAAMIPDGAAVFFSCCVLLICARCIII